MGLGGTLREAAPLFQHRLRASMHMTSSIRDFGVTLAAATFGRRAGTRATLVVRRAVHGFFAHNCLIGASALSYSTILSFLPLTAIVLVIFSSVPALAEAKDRFLSLLLANFA